MKRSNARGSNGMMSYFTCCEAAEVGNDLIFDVHAEGAVQLEPVPAHGPIDAAVVEVAESRIAHPSRWPADETVAVEAPAKTGASLNHSYLDYESIYLSADPLVKDGEEIRQLQDWDIVVQKEGDSNCVLGLSLTFHYLRLAVVKEVLNEGLIFKHNDEHKGEKTAVQIGDVLVAVNGVTNDTEKMLASLKQVDAPLLSFRRVKRFEAVISKSLWTVLGLNIKENTQEVHQVNAGCVLDYNKSCEAGMQLLPGDKIIGVNGKRTAPQELQAVGIMSGGYVRLVVSRGS